ncbi:hypothetical protein P7K49_030544 [Saguinus oedipus]|uniref:EGF-like domain-containing protein n=1 Tax=Saguinus oedipus TaxID=9490 RepID=A0ABQ9U3B0_SAGOE|nr:hypothetical protein P7K49_030544 [Saguinus oedipus]
MRPGRNKDRVRAGCGVQAPDHIPTVAQGPSKRCDVKTTLATHVPCTSCAAVKKQMCPPGWLRELPDQIAQDCRYEVQLGGSVVSMSGCRRKCWKYMVEKACCPGYWGSQCYGMAKRGTLLCSSHPPAALGKPSAGATCIPLQLVCLMNTQSTSAPSLLLPWRRGRVWAWVLVTELSSAGSTECPGGAETPCNGHGTCLDGIDRNGTCVCQENFRGSACQECQDPNQFGPDCQSAVCTACATMGHVEMEAAGALLDTLAPTVIKVSSATATAWGSRSPMARARDQLVEDGAQASAGPLPAA